MLKDQPDLKPGHQAHGLIRKLRIEVDVERMGAACPFRQAPKNEKAIHTGKPGDRFANTISLAENLETLSINTGLLADAQLFNDLLVRLRVTPF